MRKFQMLMVLGVLCLSVGTLYAQTDGISGALDVTYQSKYISYGEASMCTTTTVPSSPLSR